MRTILITAACMFILTLLSAQSETADSTLRYSIRASYGLQSLISPSADGLSSDINELNLDPKNPLFSTNTSESYPAFTVGGAIYGLKGKNIFLSLTYSRNRHDRTSSFLFHATDINGNSSDLNASIYSDHRTNSFMIGSGWIDRLSNNGMLFLEANGIFLTGTIEETMVVSGYRPVKSTVDGIGAGGKLGVGMVLPLFGPVSLRLDGNFTLAYVWYNTDYEKYSGDHLFGYSSFGCSAGLEFFLWE